MGYNRENYLKVKGIIAERRGNAIKAAELRKKEVHMLHPDIERIDSELSRTGLLVMEEIGKGGEDLTYRIENIRLDNLELQEERRRLLVKYGYGEDYTDIKYTCPLCSDTGIRDTKICTCMKKMLVQEGMKSAGLDKLFERQNFDTFSLGYYAYDEKVYNLMKHYLKMCKDYADEFSEDTKENMLLLGGTGLGKTHLTTAIAAEVVKKGHDVCYRSVQNIISDFQFESFGNRRGEDGGKNIDTNRYFDCDLLIIDDLGTEMVNQFTVSCIYNIVNTRLVSAKPMIINTNLTRDEMRKKYTDRIASRLFGEFTSLYFQGRDIRFLKLEG